MTDAQFLRNELLARIYDYRALNILITTTLLWNELRKRQILTTPESIEAELRFHASAGMIERKTHSSGLIHWEITAKGVLERENNP